MLTVLLSIKRATGTLVAHKASGVLSAVRRSTAALTSHAVTGILEPVAAGGTIERKYGLAIGGEPFVTNFNNAFLTFEDGTLIMWYANP